MQNNKAAIHMNDMIDRAPYARIRDLFQGCVQTSRRKGCSKGRVQAVTSVHWCRNEEEFPDPPEDWVERRQRKERGLPPVASEPTLSSTRPRESRKIPAGKPRTDGHELRSWSSKRTSRLLQASERKRSLQEIDIFARSPFYCLIAGRVDMPTECPFRFVGEDFSPIILTGSCCLGACGSFKAIDYGEEIDRHGLLEGTMDAYKTMRKSQEEFFEAGMLPQPSVEDVNRILRTVRKMPGRFSLSHLHPFMIKSGLDAHVSAGNHLVVVLIQSGNIPGAHLVFERLAHPNVGSWNALIGGYNNCNQSQFALTLYEKFQDVDSLKPTGYTYVELLKACKKLKDMERGLLLHSECPCPFSDLGGNPLIATAIDAHEEQEPQVEVILYEKPTNDGNLILPPLVYGNLVETLEQKPYD
ncbi:hypothetical protein GOP47_0026293 [Adiantum capillus-veneris]|nr:hypothetical protein GOP47_0026293 [Adiantum capillus-veneris]